MKKFLVVGAALCGSLLLSACATKPPVSNTSAMPSGPVIGKAYFGFNSAALVPAQEKGLCKVIEQAKADQKSAAGKFKVVVLGFADANGNPDYNFGLGYKRINAVTTYLESQGVLASQIDMLNKRTYGSVDQQVCDKNKTDYTCESRRVEVRLEQ